MSINGKGPTTIGEVLNILEPVFTAQHFHIRLVLQLRIVSFFLIQSVFFKKHWLAKKYLLNKSTSLVNTGS